MQEEINDLTNHFEIEIHKKNKAGFRVYSFNKKNTKVVVVSPPIDGDCKVDSVGSQAAAATTVWAIEKFSPDLIINAGTAGGFKDSSVIGDVHFCHSVEYLDRFIPLGDFEPYSIGFFVINPFEGGSLFTSNKLLTTKEEIEKIKSKPMCFPIIKDMEGAAIAQVANWYGVEVDFIKSITDLIDINEENTQQQFQDNFNLATHNLVIELLIYLNRVCV